MSDDFIENLRNDWTRQAAEQEVEHLRGRLSRTRRLPHAMAGGELVGGLVALASGVWFAIAAWERHDLLLALSAVVSAGIAPVLAAAAVIARLPAFTWEGGTPEGVLRHAAARNAAARRAIRLGYAGAVVLAALVAVLWVCAALGLTPASPFLVAVTTLWLACALIAWLWLQHRSRRVAGEAERCAVLMREFEGEDEP